MRTVPKPLLAASTVTVVAFLVFAVWLVARSKPAGAPSETGAAASSTVKQEQTKKPLVFTFKDDTVAPLDSDTRPDTWTFYVDNQFIGATLLSPGAPGKTAPPSFDQWVKGLGGEIALGDVKIPVKSVTISGYKAIAFSSADPERKAANLIVEVQGHVLWLQSQTDQKALEDFLTKIDKIEKTS